MRDEVLLSDYLVVGVVLVVVIFEGRGYLFYGLLYICNGMVIYYFCCLFDIMGLGDRGGLFIWKRVVD